MSTIKLWKELYDDMGGDVPPQIIREPNCIFCEEELAEIWMVNYARAPKAPNESCEILLCVKCATQLARNILEDICDINGNRHG